ncbi:FUN14 domain-containing protein 1B-like [Ciona intestinalis]
MSEAENNRVEEDSFEVLDLTELANRGNTLYERVLQNARNFATYQPASQIAIGGTGGLVVGYLFKKVGRVVASAVGGGLLIMQVAHQTGYVTINWRKVNRDANRAQRNLRDEHPAINSTISKVKEVFKSNAAVSVGFAGGFLMGMAT